MPVRLSTTIGKISLMANSTNQMLVTEFYEYMKNNDCSEKHINNNLKAIMNFADNLEPTTTFFDIRRKDQILIFLDIKIKTIEEDPDGKWITTWNHYLSHIKYFFRWLYNIYNNRHFLYFIIVRKSIRTVMKENDEINDNKEISFGRQQKKGSFDIIVIMDI